MPIIFTCFETVPVNAHEYLQRNIFAEWEKFHSASLTYIYWLSFLLYALVIPYDIDYGLLLWLSCTRLSKVMWVLIRDDCKMKADEWIDIWFTCSYDFLLHTLFWFLHRRPTVNSSSRWCHFTLPIARGTVLCSLRCVLSRNVWRE